jgi:hypothetical protein
MSVFCHGGNDGGIVPENLPCQAGSQACDRVRLFGDESPLNYQTAAQAPAAQYTWCFAVFLLPFPFTGTKDYP